MEGGAEVRVVGGLGVADAEGITAAGQARGGEDERGTSHTRGKSLDRHHGASSGALNEDDGDGAGGIDPVESEGRALLDVEREVGEGRLRENGSREGTDNGSDGELHFECDIERRWGLGWSKGLLECASVDNQSGIWRLEWTRE